MAARGEAQLRRRCISANPGFAGSYGVWAFRMACSCARDLGTGAIGNGTFGSSWTLLDDFDGPISARAFCTDRARRGFGWG